MTDKIDTPATYVPMHGMAFGAEGDEATPVTRATPLPISPFTYGARTPYYIGISFENITADSHFGLIDKSDTTNYPHVLTGRIDLYATYVSGQRVTGNAECIITIGVITAIDGTSATVSYLQGVRLSSLSTRDEVRDRDHSLAPIRLGQSGGVLTQAIGAPVSGITGINTGVTLAGPDGLPAFTPAVGDLVWSVVSVNGTISGTVAVKYLVEESEA